MSAHAMVCTMREAPIIGARPVDARRKVRARAGAPALPGHPLSAARAFVDVDFGVAASGGRGGRRGAADLAAAPVGGLTASVGAVPAGPAGREGRPAVM